jgi:hypothetical protein
MFIYSSVQSSPRIRLSARTFQRTNRSHGYAPRASKGCQAAATAPKKITRECNNHGLWTSNADAAGFGLAIGVRFDPALCTCTLTDLFEASAIHSAKTHSATRCGIDHIPASRLAGTPRQEWQSDAVLHALLAAVLLAPEMRREYCTYMTNNSLADQKGSVDGAS